MKRVLLTLLLVLVAAAGAYWLGPTAQFGAIRTEPIRLDADPVKLERQLAEAESRAGLKPDNHARICWANGTQKRKTRYSFVYLHGFGASWAEGEPIHRKLAARFGANLYLARLDEHGVQSPDAMKTLTPARYVASAERALAIGQALGDSVVLLGTSAGGMLSLYLAAHHPNVAGLLLYSPCVAAYNPALKLVTGPWGEQLVRRVMGGEYTNITWYSTERARYWLTRYHVNGLLTLQALLDTEMIPTTFRRIRQPVFMGYYYQDDAHQDHVVSVPAMLAMYDELGTPASRKRKISFPKAGEHVISSYFTSKDLTGVYRESERFLREVMGLRPLPGHVVKPNHLMPGATGGLARYVASLRKKELPLAD